MEGGPTWKMTQSSRLPSPLPLFPAMGMRGSLDCKDAAMARFGRFILACAVAAVLAVPLAGLSANPPAADPETVFKNTLLVQQAMEQARYALLQQGNPKKAVLILEEHLSRI